MGNHLEYRNNVGHRKMNHEVQKLVDSGMSIRTAYRTVEKARAEKFDKAIDKCRSMAERYK